MTDPAPGKPTPDQSGSAVSPLAVPFPEIGEVDGVTLSTASAGFYKHARRDVVLMRFVEGSTCAGVFTRHAVGSAPVDACRAALAASGGAVRAVVVNAGCANAFTAAAGDRAVRTVVEAVASELGCGDAEVLTASTGVIGVPLQAGRILNVLGELAGSLDPLKWPDAAQAIMTTDTFPKGAVRCCDVGGRRVKVAGIAKGSGMIAPDMATMLSFLATDAAVPAADLQRILSAATGRTWNRVTVDGDRSTNDTCLLIATGRAATPAGADLAAFAQAVEAVCLDLAQQLVRDGEGATKFVQVEVTGAASEASAARIARTIAESPLVKTALAGEDANWGRVAAAAGRADEPLDRVRLSIRFGDPEDGLWAARDGAVSADYDEAAMSAYMKRAELKIAVDVGVGGGVGGGTATIWTCDLTHGYIAINGDYRS